MERGLRPGKEGQKEDDRERGKKWRDKKSVKDKKREKESNVQCT